MADVLQDQAEGLRRLLARDTVRVVTLTSGRTGVGKTNIVINLAAALAKRGRHVLVLDEQQGKGCNGAYWPQDPDLAKRRTEFVPAGGYRDEGNV